MAYKKKYKPGRLIHTMSVLARHINDGKYVFLNHKPQHPGWLRSMSFHTLDGYVRNGRARVAVLNSEEKTNG